MEGRNEESGLGVAAQPPLSSSPSSFSCLADWKICELALCSVLGPLSLLLCRRHLVAPASAALVVVTRGGGKKEIQALVLTNKNAEKEKEG